MRGEGKETERKKSNMVRSSDTSAVHWFTVDSPPPPKKKGKKNLKKKNIKFTTVIQFSCVTLAFYSIASLTRPK